MGPVYNPVAIKAEDYAGLRKRCITALTFVWGLMGHFFEPDVLKTSNYEGTQVVTKNGLIQKDRLDRRLIMSVLDQAELEFPGQVLNQKSFSEIRSQLNTTEGFNDNNNIMIRFVARTYPPCWVLKARIQKHQGKPLLFHDKCPGLFYVHHTTPGTYSFTSHPKDEAIMVKCLAQGHKRRDRPGRDSNPHSGNTRT